MRTLIDRRSFLKTSAALAVSAAAGRYVQRNAYGASRDRVTIYHSSVADSINPYNHSSSPDLRPMAACHRTARGARLQEERLCRRARRLMAVSRKQVDVQAEKNIKFHNGAPLTSKDVAFSVEKMRDEKGGSLQASNFKDVTEIQTPDDLYSRLCHQAAEAVFLDRLENRFMLEQSRRR